MHVGDRFTLSGNDTATRDVCSVLWVANPEETGFFIKMVGDNDAYVDRLAPAYWGSHGKGRARV